MKYNKIVAVKYSVIDYPGQLCNVIFVKDCNFRCRYCYNCELWDIPVGNSLELDQDLKKRILNFTEGKYTPCSAVCITGAEPLFQETLPEQAAFIRFLEWLKANKILIKIDTNGYFPNLLADILSRKLVDYVAIDVKGTEQQYPYITNSSMVDVSRIKHSIELVKESGIEHEVRTTILPGITQLEDFKEINKIVAGCQRYYLQQFVWFEGIEDTTLKNISFHPAFLKQLFDKAKEELEVDQVFIR